jgi:membrane fusion protein, multidrug efflux system
MNSKKSRIIALVIIIVAVGLVAFKLSSNKKKFNDAVSTAQRQVDRIAVSVDSVFEGTIGENVTATGILEPSAVLNLVSETQGRIVKVFKKKGENVSVGQVIVKVDDEVISANVLTAEANYTQFEKDVARFTRLAEENAIAKRDLEQASIGLKKAKADLINARKALNNTSIKAPISGYINNDFVTEGQLLGGGSQVCEIVNNSSLKLNIKITEYEVYKIKIGQDVTVHLTAFPDKSFTGRISSIAEKADAAMKFNVEITLANNASSHLKSGLYAEVTLPVKSMTKLLIKKSAIVGSMEKPVVFVAKDGKAERREIVIGHSNDEFAEVLQGLSKNEHLIVSGQLNLKNNDEIKIVE